LVEYYFLDTRKPYISQAISKPIPLSVIGIWKLDLAAVKQKMVRVDR
jgi:hypothetical protein